MLSKQCLAFLTPLLMAASASARFIMYYDEWHPDRPNSTDDRAGIDHVVMAFAYSNNTAAFNPKIPISTIRSEYPNAKVMAAIGGWGDYAQDGFPQVSSTETSRTKFANDIVAMIQTHGLDGVDIDWEYPGGNGAAYKQYPNSGKTGEIAAFPAMLASIRQAIGKDKLLSVAVPGLKRDMIAYTADNGPKIWPSVDYINIMSYDLMNRRDNVTKHHTSVKGSLAVIDNYIAIGAPPEKINLGFAYYAKWFTLQGDCGSQPLGCPVVPAEDPTTGDDAGTSGAWTFETSNMVAPSTPPTVSTDGTCGSKTNTKCSSGCCGQYGYCGTSKDYCGAGCQHAFGTGCTGPDVAGSWFTALKEGSTDTQEGAQYYVDNQNKIFWTWDTVDIVAQKFTDIVHARKLGGVMAWSLGEDSYDWSHIKAMAKGLQSYPSSAVSMKQTAQTTDTETTQSENADYTQDQYSNDQYSNGQYSGDQSSGDEGSGDEGSNGFYNWD